MEAREQNAAALPNANKVHVTGFPSFTQPQDLKRVFSEYGAVTLDKVTKRFATLSYDNDDDAKAAIENSMKINIYGEFLVVKPHFNNMLEPTSPRKEFPQSKRGGEILSPHRIDLSGDFYQQLDNVMAAVRLTQEEVNKLSQLYADLERVLQTQWPGCTALPFGSITTGLGIKSSDADCFINIPLEFRVPNANYVMKAKRILQQHEDLFTEIIPIPRANTPIIKLFHIPCKTNCDVTFKTPLGTQNSRLIAFLLHADPRFIPMAVVIKYWAKVHGLSGTGKLTNYALTLMIIFYLQQNPISILPSIRWLQKNVADCVVIDNWNAGFMCDRQRLPRSTNTSTVLELLGGFFEYYSTFKFSENIVCPYLGYPVKKEIFARTAALPPEFELYRNNIEKRVALPLKFTTAICVQDPLEHSHNVASVIYNKIATDLQMFFKYAAQSYEQGKVNGYQLFLKAILLFKPKSLRQRNIVEYKVNLCTRDIATVEDTPWKSVVKEVLDVIFGDILKLTLHYLDERVTDSKKEKVRYTATATKAVWKRKQFTRLYGAIDLGFVEKQKRITEEIMLADKQTFELKFQLLIIFSDEPKKAALALKIINGDINIFREFGKFFSASIPAWFKSVLRPYLMTSVSVPDGVAESTRLLDGEMGTSSDSEEDSPADAAAQVTGNGIQAKREDAEESSSD